ncbi:hypothetical protein Zm00014a_020889 [Zea mays]|uniref:Uncharacterized protein n=1 Tax=Zea mays TaxID=4577 RepID=A0A3L6DS58_MAIZE|nr:hypothetical protein Zm00014a_020889 [Zea mays]
MAGEMSWVGKKIHLYNVTMVSEFRPCFSRLRHQLGLMLDPRLILGIFASVPAGLRVDILVLILLWFICFNGSRFATDVYESHLKARIFQGANYGMGIGMPSS